MRGSAMRRFGWLLCAGGLAGCFGKAGLEYSTTVAAPTSDAPTVPTVQTPPGPCVNAPPDVPVTVLQRQNGVEYQNTQRVLFRSPALSLTLEAGTSAIITQLEAQKIDDAAVIAVATGGHYPDAPCDVTGAGSD